MMEKPFYRLTPKEMFDQLKRLDRKTQIKLGSMLGGSLCFLILVFWPAWVVRPQVQNQIEALRAQLQSLEAQVQNEAKLREEDERHEATVAEIHGRLFTEEELQGLLGILAKLGEESRVAILSSSPQSGEEREEKIPEEYAKDYLQASYLITVEGGYHEIAMFVSRIESYQKLFRIEGLSITPREESPSSHIGEVYLTGFALRGGSTI